MQRESETTLTAVGGVETCEQNIEHHWCIKYVKILTTEHLPSHLLQGVHGSLYYQPQNNPNNAPWRGNPSHCLIPKKIGNLVIPVFCPSTVASTPVPITISSCLRQGYGWKPWSRQSKWSVGESKQGAGGPNKMMGLGKGSFYYQTCRLRYSCWISWGIYVEFQGCTFRWGAQNSDLFFGCLRRITSFHPWALCA